jgi:hypothetical protein
MKKPYSLLAIILILTIFKASAQNNSGSGFDQLIKSSPGDVTKLIHSYAEPLFKGFGTGLNSGWNNTARTKKLLHFDLHLTANAAWVPDMGKSFDVTKIGLSNHIAPADPSNVIAPTFAGAQSDGPRMNIKDDNGVVINNFTMPKGVLSFVPAPTVQLTIGLVANTDITVRFAPPINLGGDKGSVKDIGFGIKHNIIQDFAGAKKIIPFDLALAVNYNKITYTKPLSVQPTTGSQPAPGTQAADFSTQSLNADVSGLNVQAIISKKMHFFTPFFAVAYQTATSNMSVLGNYPIQSTAPGQSLFYTTISNPVNINETSISGLRADIGFQLEASIFRFYASYSVGEYQSGNVGIGLGF